MRSIYAFTVELEAPKAGSATASFEDALKKYKLEFNPRRWYTHEEFSNLFKTLRGRMQAEIDSEKKKLEKDAFLKHRIKLIEQEVKDEIIKMESDKNKPVKVSEGDATEMLAEAMKKRRLDKADGMTPEQVSGVKDLIVEHTRKAKEVRGIVPEIVKEFQARLEEAKKGMSVEDRKKVNEVAWDNPEGLTDKVKEHMHSFSFELKPPEVGSVTSRFMDIIHKYENHPKIESGPQLTLTMDPRKWYTPKELTVIFKTLRGRVEAQIEHDSKKQTVQDKEIKPAEWAIKVKEKTKDHIALLKEARKILPDMIGEYRTRMVDAMKNLSEEEKAQIKDTTWIEHPSEQVSKWQDILMDDAELKRLMDPLAEEHKLDQKETHKTTQPQKGWGAMDETKWHDIKNEMAEIQKYVFGLAKKMRVKEDIPAVPELKSASDVLAGDPGLKELKAPPSHQQTVDDFMSLMKDLEEQHEKLMKGADKIEKEKEKKILDGLKDLKGVANETIEILPSKNSPEKISSILIHELEWFKKMHSMYHGVKYIHDRAALKGVEEEHGEIFRKADIVIAVEIGALETLHDKLEKMWATVLWDMDHFAGMEVVSPYTNKAAGIALKACKAFYSEFSAYFDLYSRYMKGEKGNAVEKPVGVEPTPPIKSASIDYDKIGVSLGESAVVKDFDAIFPRARALSKLETLEDKHMVKWAEEELDDMYEFFKKEYINPSKRLKAHAEEDGKTPQSMIEEVVPQWIEAFVARWLDVGHVTKEETSEKIDKKYGYLSDLLTKMQDANIFPTLALNKITPVSGGIPSRKDLMDYLEKEWLDWDPITKKGVKDFKSILKELFDKSGNPATQVALEKFKNVEKLHGGGGASGGREKTPKPIVSLVQEELESDMTDFLEGPQTVKEFMNEKLKDIGTRVHSRIDAGDMVDRKTVIEAIVKLMQNYAHTIKRLVISFPVGKSHKLETFSPAGFPKDIPSKKASNLPYEIVCAAVDISPKHDESGRPSRYFGTPPGHGKPKTAPYYKTLSGPGPVSQRPQGSHIMIPAEERGLEKAKRIMLKIDEFKKAVEKIAGGKDMGSIYPVGFEEGIESLRKEPVISNPEDIKKMREKQKMEQERKQKQDIKDIESNKDLMHSASIGQMTYRVAAAFVEVGETENPMESLLS